MSYGQLGAVVGNVVGSYFGGPVGGAIGSAIGGYVGASFDPTIVSTGPRLNDAKIQDGSFGSPITISFGTVRAAGTVIFETKIREHLHTEDTSGKGGQQTESQTYTYDFDFAVVLSDQHGRPVRGIKGIRRIWANGQLVYSAANNTTLATLIASGEFCDETKVYLGTDDQMPDPTIEAECGAGNVSAYRGYAYVVFRGAKVYQTGQPAPQMEFEIVQDGTEEVGKHLFATYQPKAPEAIAPGVPWIGRDRLLVMNFEPGYSGDGNMVHTSIFFPGVDNPDVNRFHIFGSYSGFAPTIVNCTEGPYAADINFVSGDPLDGMLFQMYQIDRTGGLPVLSVPLECRAYPEWTLPGSSRVAFEDGTLNYAIAHTGGPDYYYGRNIFSSVSGPCPIKPGRRIVDIAIYLDELYVWNGDVEPLANGETQTYLSVYGPSAELMREWIHTSEGFLNAGFQWAALCVNEHGAFTWSPAAPNSRVARARANGVEMLCVEADPPDGGFGDASHRISFWSDGQIANLGMSALSGDEGEQVATAWTIQFKALAKTTVPVGEVVSIIANIAGLDVASEIDVSQLTEEMRGYSFKRVGPANAVIEPLATCFFFEGYESEGKVKFARLGGPTVRAIPFDDLAYASDESLVEAFPLVRTQEKDLPRSLSLTYANPGADYQTGAEPPARRVTTTSVNDVQLEMPIVFTSDEAAERQFVLLYKMWTERNTRQIFLSRKHADLEPTDPLDIEYPRGVWSRWRLKHVENQGQVISCDLVADEPADLVSYAVPGNPAAETTTIPLPSPTIVEFLDVPIFSDAYNDPGFYVAMGGRNKDWHGASLLRSINGTTFEPVDAVSKSAAIGQCVTALAGYSGVMPFDEHAVMRVRIRTFGTDLQSFTENDLLLDGGKNAAVIGDEIVQFRSASLIEKNLWELRGFLRGMRGTEWAIGGHGDDERFVLIGAAGTLRVNYGVADLFVSRQYKAVSRGKRDADAVAFTNTGVGLKPFAPVNLGSTQRPSADIAFTFERRTRLAVNQVVAGPIPLGEAVEAYEIEIGNDAAFGVVVRTLAAASSPAVYGITSLAVDKQAGLVSPLHWRVFQISGVVGRGFPSVASIQEFTVRPGAGGIAGVVAELLFDGPAGSSTFVDQTGRPLEVSGFVSIDDAQSREGGTSAYFPGGSRLIYPASPDWSIGGDWRITMSFRFDNLDQGTTTLFTVGGYYLTVGTYEIGTVFPVDRTVDPPVGGVQVVTDFWYDLEIRNENEVMSFYLNKIKIHTQLYRIDDTPASAAEPLYLGSSEYDMFVQDSSFRGWMDNFKMTRGPLPPLVLRVPVVAFDLVTFLPDGSIAFRDGSSNAAAATVGGDAHVQSSALLLDGTGDFVSFDSDAAFNWAQEDFKLEAKFKTTNTSTPDMTIVSRAGVFRIVINDSLFGLPGFIAVYVAGIAEPFQVNNLVGTTTNYANGFEHKVELLRENSNLIVRINDQGAAGIATAMTFADVAAPFVIGSDLAGSDFAGSIRQVRLTRYT